MPSALLHYASQPSAPLPGPAASADLPDLHFRLLGNFQVARGGQVVTGFTYDKVRALLAYLILEPGEHRREALGEMFWPETRGDSSRSNLRRCLFVLRQALGDDTARESLFAGGRSTLSLPRSPRWDCDVLRFLAPPANDPGSQGNTQEDMTSRVAAYGGALLAGFCLPDAPEFENWLTLRRESLHNQCLDLLETLSRESEHRGSLTTAMGYAQRAIDLDFWRESAQLIYLELLARSSPQRALAHFDQYRMNLDQELGLRPGASIMALAGKIARGQTGPREPVPPTRPATVIPMHPAPLAFGPSLPARDTSTANRITVLAWDIAIPDTLAEDAAQTLPRLAEAQHWCRAFLSRAGWWLPPGLESCTAYLAAPGHDPAGHAAQQTGELALALWEAARSALPDCRLRLALHTGWGLTSATGDSPDITGRLAREAIRLTGETPWENIRVSEAWIDAHSEGMPPCPPVWHAAAGPLLRPLSPTGRSPAPGSTPSPLPDTRPGSNAALLQSLRRLGIYPRSAATLVS